MKGWFNPALTAEQKMIKFAQHADQNLISALVDEFNDDLYHYLLSQSEPSLAEDILQNTWLKVIEKRALYRMQLSFKSWLFILARNSLIDELRRQKRWNFSQLEDHCLTTSVSIDKLIQLESFQQAFDLLIKELPFAQREAFILQQDGFSLSEISTITNDNIETIKSRLRYARNYFKRHLEQVNVK